MKVITAPEKYTIQKNDIACFLAGGIIGCSDWQSEVVNYIRGVEKYDDLNSLVLFNPRSLMTPSTIEEQIKWEFKFLNSCDIFSMYFDGSDSLQPICLYELGRYLNIFTGLWIASEEEFKKHCIVSVHKDYRRPYDVIIQTELATEIKNFVRVVNSPIEHANAIVMAYEAIANG